MVEDLDASNVRDFKDQVKQYIKSSNYKKGIEYVNIKIEGERFQELQLREQVTVLHWYTKVFLKACDLRSLTAKCLTRVNTTMNNVMTSPAHTFKQADGRT